MSKKDETRYNSMGTNIEERILDGRTKFFTVEKKKDAEEHAFQKRSYVDDCYYRIDEGKFILVGYTIPN